MTKDENEELDSIENIIIERRLPLEDINRHCALFLLDVIGSIPPSDKFKEGVTEITCVLRNICEPQFLETHNPKEYLGILWRAVKEYREKFPELSLVARGAMYCCANKVEWDRQNSGEETPVYYVTRTAEKINSKYSKAFIEHLRKLVSS